MRTRASPTRSSGPSGFWAELVLGGGGGPGLRDGAWHFGEASVALLSSSGSPRELAAAGEAFFVLQGMEKGSQRS